MGPRRKFTPEFKVEVVLELLAGVKSSAARCREHQIAPSVLADWKASFLARASSLFKNPEPHEAQGATRVAELERLVGRLTLENDILTKATSLLPQRSRPNMRSCTCSANLIPCARSAVCWALRAAAMTISHAPEMRRPCRRPSSASLGHGRPMATGGSPPSDDVRIS
jgi:transposase